MAVGEQRRHRRDQRCVSETRVSHDSRLAKRQKRAKNVKQHGERASCVRLYGRGGTRKASSVSASTPVSHTSPLGVRCQSATPERNPRPSSCSFCYFSICQTDRLKQPEGGYRPRALIKRVVVTHAGIRYANAHKCEPRAPSHGEGGAPAEITSHAKIRSFNKMMKECGWFKSSQPKRGISWNKHTVGYQK